MVSTPQEIHNNEIGVDIAGLQKHILGIRIFGENDYHLTHRRYFDGSNLNTAIRFQYANSFTNETGDSAIE